MSTLIPNIARTKVILIILPDNVHNITPLSELVTVMTIILNAMLRHGVNKTVITLQPAPFRSMLMNLVRVTTLYIKTVRQIMPELVRILVMSTLVLPVRNSKTLPDDALMIPLTEPAVRRQDVRLIRL